MTLPSNFELMKHLTNVEVPALSKLKPIDLTNFDPVVVMAKTPANQKLWHYWRVALSSEGQGSMTITQGRYQLYFVMDSISGGLLGIFALGDPPMVYPYFEQQFGWHERTGTKNGRAYNVEKWAKLNSILYIHRCLPVYEFGSMLGGKLITLMATSKELIRGLEIRYSFMFSLFLIRTLHGKSSQYNRLHPRGIVEVGVDEGGRGMMWMELRKNGLKYLHNEAPALGKPLTHTMKDQVEYWKTRWLAPRMESKGVTLVTPDPSKYMVSNRFSLLTDPQPTEEQDEEHVS